MFSVALPFLARPSQRESLGDLARQLREQKDKDAKKTTKVFTNDNLPAPNPGRPYFTPAPPDEPFHCRADPSKPATPPASQETSGKPPETPEDKVKTREYWQGKFKAARRTWQKQGTAGTIGR